MRLFAGGEVWHDRFDHAKKSLAAYQDVLPRNINESLLMLSCIVFTFQRIPL
jgi:hypothetical protein